jgi:DNA-binding NarL/FixJ family response regulator
MLAAVRPAPHPKARIRALVAAESPIALGGICLLLGTQSDMEVAGTASSGAELIEKAEHLEPDLVIAEASLPGIDGFACASQLRRVMPRLRIVLLTEPDSDVSPSMCREAGADACLSKNQIPEGLLSEIRGLFFARAS